jgi:hypothetical protein
VPDSSSRTGGRLVGNGVWSVALRQRFRFRLRIKNLDRLWYRPQTRFDRGSSRHSCAATSWSNPAAADILVEVITAVAA